jgi:hypothetical protein
MDPDPGIAVAGTLYDPSWYGSVGVSCSEYQIIQNADPFRIIQGQAPKYGMEQTEEDVLENTTGLMRVGF